MIRFVKPITLFAMIVLAVPGFSLANNHWFLGGAAGPADLGVGGDAFDDGTLTSSSVDDSDIAWKAIVGYQFGRRFGLEAGYVDLNGDFDSRRTFEGISSGGGLYAAGNVSVDLEPETTYLAAIIALYRNGALNIYGKYGITEWEADVITVDSAGSVTSGIDGSDEMYGAGLEYRFRNGWALRAEWEQFGDIAGRDIEMISGGVIFNFPSRR